MNWNAHEVACPIRTSEDENDGLSGMLVRDGDRRWGFFRPFADGKNIWKWDADLISWGRLIGCWRYEVIVVIVHERPFFVCWRLERERRDGW